MSTELAAGIVVLLFVFVPITVGLLWARREARAQASRRGYDPDPRIDPPRCTRRMPNVMGVTRDNRVVDLTARDRARARERRDEPEPAYFAAGGHGGSAPTAGLPSYYVPGEGYGPGGGLPCQSTRSTTPGVGGCPTTSADFETPCFPGEFGGGGPCDPSGGDQ